MESKKKKSRNEDYELKEMIHSMQDIFFNKLKNIEEKIDQISSKYLILEKKVENIMCNLQGIPDNNLDSSDRLAVTENSATSETSVDDYPNGSWLGDPENSDFRVRCHITPKDLDYINNSCTTPEKMSLTLLDYLFPREVQACSNLAGGGRHLKKQLDPDKIYGIKCHVSYIFGINEKDWHRIKLNIDSKCRTAFRRKVKGKPLNIKGSRARALYKQKKNDENSRVWLMKSEVSDNSNLGSEDFEDLESSPTEKCPLPGVFPVKLEESTSEDCSVQHVLPVQMVMNQLTFPLSSRTEIIHSELGKIQVIRATQEQFELFKQDPNIQVLAQTILPT